MEVPGLISFALVGSRLRATLLWRDSILTLSRLIFIGRYSVITVNIEITKFRTLTASAHYIYIVIVMCFRSV
jgi:hypothetical protein